MKLSTQRGFLWDLCVLTTPAPAQARTTSWVTPDLAAAVTKLGAHKIAPVVFSAEDEKKWRKTFQDIFRKK